MTAPHDLYRPVPTETVKVTGVAPERAIRLYCWSAHIGWNLQVRGPLKLANGHSGPFVVATASLDVAAMRALRDAISAWLDERAAALDDGRAVAEPET